MFTHVATEGEGLVCGGAVRQSVLTLLGALLFRDGDDSLPNRIGQVGSIASHQSLLSAVRARPRSSQWPCARNWNPDSCTDSIGFLRYAWAIMSEITKLLARVREGDTDATHELLPLVYAQLRRLAHGQRQLQAGHTLCTTALVHEVYLSLFTEQELDWESRVHFFRYAAKAMRNILVDEARRRGAEKRGGGSERVDLDDVQISLDDSSQGMLALDRALGRLEAQSGRLADVVSLRFFAGLSVEDTARALGVTSRSIVRDWRKARAILHHYMAGADV